MCFVSRSKRSSLFRFARRGMLASLFHRVAPPPLRCPVIVNGDLLLTMTASSVDPLICGLDDESPIPLEQFTAAVRGLDGDGDLAQVSSVEVVSSVVQPGSHSGVLRLGLSNSEPSNRLLFLKKVAAASVGPGRPWPDRRRTLAYARTEMRFFSEFVADPEIGDRLTRAGVRIPRLALSDNQLDEVLGESPVHAAASEEPSPSTLRDGGALLFIECAEGFLQASPVSKAQAEQALKAVATLHAACWEDETLLDKASGPRLRVHRVHSKRAPE